MMFSLHALLGLKLQKKSLACILSTTGPLEDTESTSVHPAAFLRQVFNDTPIHAPLDRGLTHKKKEAV